MAPARLVIRLFAVALMMGGVLGATVLAHSGVAGECVAGDTEVPSESEGDKEKTVADRPKSAAIASARAEAFVAHATAHSASRGAPPTPPPQA